MNTRRLMVGSVVAAALLVYLNSLANGFAYDDSWIIVQNPRIRDLANLGKIWLTPYWPAYGTELGLYRPLTIFMFALQWQIAENAPWLFHLVNVLLHAATSALVFLLIERLINRRAALAGALLFAIHPLHTEAVSNVVGQAELWVALTVLGACLLYSARPESRLTTARLLLILLLYALGLLAKESAVVLPGLLVLLDVVQRRIVFTREGLKRYVGDVAFLILLLTLVLCAYLTLRLSVLGNLAGTDAAPGLPYLREQFRVLNALRAWPEFMRLLFFPLDLSVDYAPGVILPVESFTPMVLLGLLLVVATVLLSLAAPWRPFAGLVAGWFLITILPVANFFFPIGVLIAERTLYLPSVAVCFIAGLAWDHGRQAAARETRRLTAALAAVVVVAFGIRTIVRNPDWKDLGTVWFALQRDHPEAYRSQWVHASENWVAGNMPVAEQYFMLASRIWGRDSQLLNDLGNFYIVQRRYDLAVSNLERSRAMTPFLVHTYESLAYAYLYAGRPRDALQSAYHALSIGGNQKALMYAVIGGAHERLGNFADAAGAWQIATRQPSGGMWLYWSMLARARASAGYRGEATVALDSATARASSNQTGLEVIGRLRQAIDSGCYPAGGPCDALAGWIIAVAPPPSALAKSNAAAKRNAPSPSGTAPPNRSARPN
jgi:protein O-mannosyl-transferase